MPHMLTHPASTYCRLGRARRRLVWDAFQKALSHADGRGLGIIKGFANGQFPPSDKNRWALAHYTALQIVRGPDIKRTSEYLRALMVRLEVGAGARRGKNVADRILQPGSYPERSGDRDRTDALHRAPPGPHNPLPPESPQSPDDGIAPS